MSEQGTVLGIRGTSGTGKSTIARLFAARHKPCIALIVDEFAKGQKWSLYWKTVI